MLAHRSIPITLVLLALALIPARPCLAGPSLGKLKGALGRALANGDEATAKAVFVHLGDLNSEPAAKLMVNVTTNNLQLDLSEACIVQLATMDAPRVRKWLDKNALAAKRWWERLLLLQALDRIGDQRATETFAEAASDKSPNLLEQLAELLGTRSQKSSVDALIALLENAEQQRFEDATRAARATLARLTGQEIESSIDWRNWWKRARSKFDFEAVKKGAAGKAKGGVTSVTDRIKKRDEGRYITELKKGDIIVVKGQYDQVEKVLDLLKLPYTSIERNNFASFKLSPHQVVIFNCHGEELKGPSAQKLAAFAAAGGYIFSSDWELHNVLMKAFPKVLSMKKRIDEDLVGITPFLDHAAHPYLRDVFPKNPFKLAKYRWKIDAASDLQDFSTKSGVVPLVFSHDMHKKHQIGVVALTFRWGGRVIREKPAKRRRATTGGGRYGSATKEYAGGSILHVLGHFHAQMDSSGDGFALQQMLANFIIEKQKFREARRNKKARKKR